MTTIPYKLIRTKRRSLCLQVKDCCVLVRAPLKMSTGEIERFLFEKLDWIQKQLDKQNEIKLLSSKVGESDVVYDGKIVSLVDVGYKGTVKSFYERMRKDILSFAFDVANRYDFSVKNIKWSSAKSFWGICSGENEIKFSKRLVMLPKKLYEYVIFHEFVHTIHHNHSKEFWYELSKYMPDCKSRRKELKKFSWLFKL